MKASTIIIFFLFLFSCNRQASDWQSVEVLDSALCANKKTEYSTNHQGEHTLTDCSVYIDNNTLHILFPAGLPAYWLGVETQVADGIFSTNVNGIPFGPNIELEHHVKKQQLYLDKQSYSIGDTLQGYINITFEELDKTHNQTNEFYFKGCIYKIIRDKNYQPFENDGALMSYDFDLAINEFGQPMYEEIFTTCCLPEFRVELLNIFPASDSIYIRELTWNTSEDAQVSDGGILRLTVWYAQEDSIWKPVHFLRWNKYMQF